MARGDPAPIWPLPDVWRGVPTSGGRRFGASRKGGERYHAGVDILAPRGALVVAPESGTLVRAYKFNGPRAFALLLQTDSGIVLNLAEVEPNSWREFGRTVGTSGSWVGKGESVGRVGINPGGSTMLHVEAYRAGTRANQRWFPGEDPPERLRDPTNYLLEAVGSDSIPDDTTLPTDPDTGSDGAIPSTALILLGVAIPVGLLLVVAATRK